MYRLNDAECEGPDAAPPDEKYATMKQKFDCLSESASNRVSTMIYTLYINSSIFWLIMDIKLKQY